MLFPPEFFEQFLLGYVSVLFSFSLLGLAAAFRQRFYVIGYDITKFSNCQ